jgi:hypothetical protein
MDADADKMKEVKELIAFYDKRKWNWLGATEFVLAKHSGTFDVLMTRRRYGR